jgi:hypothetical protein
MTYLDLRHIRLTTALPPHQSQPDDEPEEP